MLLELRTNWFFSKCVEAQQLTGHLEDSTVSVQAFYHHFLSLIHDLASKYTYFLISISKFIDLIHYSIDS